MLDRICDMLRIKKPAYGTGLLLASGTTVPGAVAGYRTGCIFQKTNGGAGTSFYVNEGSVTSASFQAVAALTAAQEALLGATPGTAAASKALVLGASGEIATITSATITTLTSTTVNVGTAALVEADLLKIDAITNGTVTASKAVVVSADKDASDFRNIGMTGILTNKAGAAANAVAVRLGKSATEGTEIRVIDEVVTTTNAVENNLTETVPTGAVILSVQVSLDTLIVGDASGDDGLVKVGIGTNADPDKYGKTADLLDNSKIDTIPAWAVLSGAETICVKAADTNGAAVTEKFNAGGLIHVRVVYLALNSLDNAA